MEGSENVKKIIDFFSDELEKITKLQSYDVGSQSAGSQIGQRGSLSDRLANTPDEAMTIKRADDARLGIPTKEIIEDSDQIDDEVVDRIVNDILRDVFGDQ